MINRNGYATFEQACSAAAAEANRGFDCAVIGYFYDAIEDLPAMKWFHVVSDVRMAFGDKKPLATFKATVSA